MVTWNPEGDANTYFSAKEEYERSRPFCMRCKRRSTKGDDEMRLKIMNPKRRPEESGEYLLISIGVGDDDVFMRARPYSKKHDAWNCTDRFTEEEAEECRGAEDEIIAWAELPSRAKVEKEVTGW